jgi:hypothetical protein
MTIDRTALRRRIAGWKPGMHVEIEVRELRALLDELDALTAMNRGVGIATQEELDERRRRVLAHDYGGKDEP